MVCNDAAFLFCQDILPFKEPTQVSEFGICVQEYYLSNGITSLLQTGTPSGPAPSAAERTLAGAPAPAAVV